MKTVKPTIYKDDDFKIVLDGFKKGYKVHLYAVSKNNGIYTYYCLFVCVDNELKLIAKNLRSKSIGMSRLLDAIEVAFHSEFSGSLCSYIYTNTSILNNHFL